MAKRFAAAGQLPARCRTAIALALGQPTGHERSGRRGVHRKSLQVLLGHDRVLMLAQDGLQGLRPLASVRAARPSAGAASSPA